MITLIVCTIGELIIVWLIVLALCDFGIIKIFDEYYIKREDMWSVKRNEFIPTRYYLCKKNKLFPFYSYHINYENCDNEGNCDSLESLKDEMEIKRIKKSKRSVKLTEEDLVFEEI